MSDNNNSNNNSNKIIPSTPEGWKPATIKPMQISSIVIGTATDIGWTPAEIMEAEDYLAVRDYVIASDSTIRWVHGDILAAIRQTFGDEEQELMNLTKLEFSRRRTAEVWPQKYRVHPRVLEWSYYKALTPLAARDLSKAVELLKYILYVKQGNGRFKVNDKEYALSVELITSIVGDMISGKAEVTHNQYQMSEEELEQTPIYINSILARFLTQASGMTREPAATHLNRALENYHSLYFPDKETERFVKENWEKMPKGLKEMLRPILQGEST